MTQKPQWARKEFYSSSVGLVQKMEEGWVARVYVKGKLARIKEVFESAEAAMGAVERTWERERGKG